MHLVYAVSYQSELRSCVKVEVAVVVPNSPDGFRGRKATFNLDAWTVPSVADALRKSLFFFLLLWMSLSMIADSPWPARLAGRETTTTTTIYLQQKIAGLQLPFSQAADIRVSTTAESCYLHNSYDNNIWTDKSSSPNRMEAPKG